jgi:RNA polymerase sigma-70 factor (ECF subfamily)
MSAGVAEDSSTERSPLHDPDVRLMLEVQAGSALAFEELVLRYQGRLMTVLQHLVGRRDQAEDLVQEVFLRVYRARKRYQPGARFSTWIFTIAGNVAANALRDRRRRREVDASIGQDDSSGAKSLAEMAPAASGLMPARQLDKAEMREIVRLALDTLNERQRLAVLLNKFEHMSYAEIGETMNLTPQAVKSLLSRARESLRDTLEPYLQHGTFPNLET